MGELGHKVAPGQHNAMLWKLKWSKMPSLWEISFARKKNGVLDLSIPPLIYKEAKILELRKNNTMLRKLDLRKVVLLREQRPEALSRINVEKRDLAESSK